jgi:transcriptional regulator with XRE-family HTH domain
MFMSDIKKIIGQRIRNYRTQLNLTQEDLAEFSNCHYTYIGQIERGEKNATIESIEKIVKPLNITLSKLFEKIDECSTDEKNIPLECYELISSKSKSEQEQIYKILLELEKYRNI